MGQVAGAGALAWTLATPAVTGPIIGARTQQQLNDNLGAPSTSKFSLGAPAATRGRQRPFESASARFMNGDDDELSRRRREDDR